ncbi:CPBP family intramembrane glutamic endopeptidase [Rhodococcus sp. H29-C3]|uniref:CPBP family intramembrane glutamic endopeptidase n=1 Tax=Rhodococcus sp. H29-C3 TaxID=3046307 RepID=UPI0024BA9FE2|nr:CPBP family intramembrane glutamic endopeptidase [Rhodococcus sp. H29-C3]MDJ0363406.1 CPBP family intramembrane metalloprotease [Rhodococcus sp. H29-C3]
MFPAFTSTAKSTIFIAGVLLIALTTAGVAGGLILALSPLLMTLLMMFVITRDGYSRIGWRTIGITRLGLRWWPTTLLVTAGVSALTYAAAIAFRVAETTAIAATAWPNLASLCLTGVILAFAEEIGWRGYLHAQLRERTAVVKSSIIIGVVWVCWHLPYILFTTYYHTDGNRTVVLILFSCSACAFSILFGLLRERSGSLWVAVLAHAGHNVAFAWIAAEFVNTSNPVLVNEYLAGDTGLFVLIGTVASATFLLMRRSHIKPRPRACTAA